MPGGLLQLVAYGAQDAYLTGNPQITFWRGLYKRHTNFAMEPFRVNLTGQANWGVKHSAILPRHADLVFNTYIQMTLPPSADSNTAYDFEWLSAAVDNRGGYAMIKYVELDIGGQVIDRLYGEWLYLWDKLTSDSTTATKLQSMVQPPLPSVDPTSCVNGSGRPSSPSVIYIPLFFFFTRSPGAALPLIALQYHEVKINIEWNNPEFFSFKISNQTLPVGKVPPPVDVSLYLDYIYLDVEERRRMAQESHEYLIEQTQFNEDKGINTASNRIDLTFNHPVKELVWVVQESYKTNCKLPRPEGIGYLSPFLYANVVREQRLQINGQDRVPSRYADYYTKVQSYQHHTGIAPTGVYTYSFAIRPEEHQPSGTCNFSRIDTATLVIDLAGFTPDINDATDNTFNVRVYAVNYNVLRVMSGMAGLAYSN